MTKDCALAFVAALDKSPKVSAHLEAVIGYDQVPSVKDFSSVAEKAIERSENLILYLRDISKMLDEISRARPKQKKIPLEDEVHKTRVEAASKA